jgi:hypothetical protein
MGKLNGKSGTYEANEGINILAIVEEIGRRLSATQPSSAREAG